MKKLSILTALLSVLALSGPVFAESKPKPSMHQTPDYAYGTANGYASAGATGDWVGSYTIQKSKSKASVAKGRANAGAGLQQAVGGVTMGQHVGIVDLYMFGSTGAIAKVGRLKSQTSTATVGGGFGIGAAHGDETLVYGWIEGQSKQGSEATANGRWSDANGVAMQSTEGGMMAAASGSDHASAKTTVGVSSQASVENGSDMKKEE